MTLSILGHFVFSVLHCSMFRIYAFFIFRCNYCSYFDYWHIKWLSWDCADVITRNRSPSWHGSTFPWLSHTVTNVYTLKILAQWQLSAVVAFAIGSILGIIMLATPHIPSDAYDKEFSPCLGQNQLLWPSLVAFIVYRFNEARSDEVDLACHSNLWLGTHMTVLSLVNV